MSYYEPKLYKVLFDGENRLYERNEEADIEHFWYSFDAEMSYQKEMRMMTDGGDYHPNYAVLDSGELEQFTFSVKVIKSNARFNPYKHYSGQYLGTGKRAKCYFPIEETSQWAIDRIVNQMGQDRADEELEADTSIPDDARIVIASYHSPEAVEMVLRGIPVDPNLLDEHEDKNHRLSESERGDVAVSNNRKRSGRRLYDQKGVPEKP